VIVIVAIATISGIAYWNQVSESQESIMVYSGAGLRKPMDEIGAVFENEYGIQVNYNYAGSNTLLSQIQTVERGDVYMPGATYYIETADNKGFIDEKKLVAYHTPVIAVPKGNPENIDGLKDLTENSVKVIMGDPGACAIGRLGYKILEMNGIKEEVEKNVVTKAATVNEIVMMIAQSQADAGIIWRANIYGVKKAEIENIAEENNKIKKIPIGSLSFSQKSEKAEKFVEFVSVKGKEVFENYGFLSYEN